MYKTSQRRSYIKHTAIWLRMVSLGCLLLVIPVELAPAAIRVNAAARSSSPGYNISCQTVGEAAAGSSNSTGYEVLSGTGCLDEAVDVFLDFSYLPQGRYGSAGTNDQTRVTIEVRPLAGVPASFIFSDEVTTSASGSYSGLALLGVLPGNYDITAKGWANLRLKLSNVNLNQGVNSVDFSQAGTLIAPGGDVDLTDRTGAGSSEQGDNEISAADYSVIVGNYSLTGPAYDRLDLKQFGGGPSAADYSILVGNYGVIGTN